jgi:hypothetical protein
LVVDLEISGAVRIHVLLFIAVMPSYWAVEVVNSADAFGTVDILPVRTSTKISTVLRY